MLVSCHEWNALMVCDSLHNWSCDYKLRLLVYEHEVCPVVHDTYMSVSSSQVISNKYKVRMSKSGQQASAVFVKTVESLRLNPMCLRQIVPSQLQNQTRSVQA